MELYIFTDRKGRQCFQRCLFTVCWQWEGGVSQHALRETNNTPQLTATASVGAHPTGMHFCLQFFLKILQKSCKVVKSHKNPIKQECIPVGCVPSAAVVVCWGVRLSACWIHPPPTWAWTPPPWADTPSPPPGPGSGYTHPLWTESQTGVKT